MDTKKVKVYFEAFSMICKHHCAGSGEKDHRVNVEVR